MNVGYAGKSIDITGAAGGIGRVSAELFAKLGGQVLAVDINTDALNATVEHIRAQGGRVTPVTADLTRPEEVAKFVGAALERFSKIYVLVNNAGGSFPTPMAEIDRQLFERIRSLNFDAVYHAPASGRFPIW